MFSAYISALGMLDGASIVPAIPHAATEQRIEMASERKRSDRKDAAGIDLPAVWSRLKELSSTRAARDTGWTFVVKAAHVGLGFLVTVVLARLLGAEGYGIYSYAFALVMLIALPAHAGLPPLVIRETARGLAEGRPEKVRGVWRWAGRFVAGASLVVVVVLGPILVWWQGGLGSAEGRTVAWALLLVPLVTLGNLRGAALRGMKRIASGQLPEQVLNPGLLIVLLAGAALLASSGLGPDTAMALRATAALMAFLAGAWMLWRWTPKPVRRAMPVSDRRGLAAATGLFGLIAGFQFVIGQADIVILGIFERPDQVGIYKVAFQVSVLAAFGLQVVNAVIGPRFADLHARGERSSLQEVATVAARVVLATNLVLTVAFVALGRTFFTVVFGDEFEAAFAPLLVLLAGQMVNSAAGSVRLLLTMTGHERGIAVIVGMAAILNIVLNLALIPTLGMLGAAASTAVTTITWNLLMWRRVRSDLGINSLAFGSHHR